MSTFFNKSNNNKNSPFSFNNNTNSSFSSNFQTQQSKGFDNTDRPMGYLPRLVPVNQTSFQPNQANGGQPQPNQTSNNTTQTQPNPAPINNQNQPNNFSFQKPQQNQYAPPAPMSPQNLPAGYEQEFFTYHYPTTGEIVKDLGLRVFEVVVGAAAVAAGQEVARFFSRRRFHPAIPQHDMYQQQQPQNHGQYYPNNNTWRK